MHLPSLLGAAACVAVTGSHAVVHGPRDGKAHSFTKRTENGITYDVFEHAATSSKLSLIKNSGVCETTPGVNQYSGYLSVGTNMSMWFWFFESRNAPSTSPLALWLNGGPGCSSMIGLFQENGPCHFVNNETEPSLNPYSWNEYANMLYVDQPIGTGFSYGDDEANSTVTAAPFVWTFLQAFLTAFPEYESRDFGLWTESYGGHYGPEFADFFEEQNAAIQANTVDAEEINLVALGVNNGWIDPTIQYGAYVEFGHNNSYRQLINDTQYVELKEAYATKCAPLLAECPGPVGADAACKAADDACYSYVEGVVENGPPAYPDFDVYDIRAPSVDPFPSENYLAWLTQPEILQKIGAKSTYSECANDPYYLISDTGDDARSFIGPLSDVVQSGINVLLWAGAADWICNWLGVADAAAEIQFDQSAEYNAASLHPYRVGGVVKGEYKTAGNFNFLKVEDAGHEVPAYQPELALQVFTQIMKGQTLHSTCGNGTTNGTLARRERRRYGDLVFRPRS